MASISGQQIRNALAAMNHEFKDPRNNDLTHHVELELEQALATAFDTEYAPLWGSQFVEIDNSLAMWAESWARIWYDEGGAAKLGSTMQDDAPRVDIVKSKESQNTVIISASYGWSIMELQRAAATGVALDTRKQQAVINAINRKIDELILSGDANVNYTGLSNDANVLLTNPPPGGAWSGLTAQQTVDSMLEMELGQNNRTLDARPPDTLLLPPTAFQLIHKTYGVDNGNTIRDLFIQNAAFVRRVAQWQKLETAGTGGIPRAVLYSSASDTVNFKVGTLATFLPPQARNFEFVVPVYAVVGGTEWARPGAGQYFEGF